MIALALDTSGPCASVALLRHGDDGDSVLGTETVGEGMRRGVDLFPAMERLLRRAAVPARSVELVAVGTGPGSYTGLRVGITAARAFAYASGARLLGIPSCDAWAAAAEVGTAGTPLAVVLDAKVKAVYLALYEPRGGAWARTDGPLLLAPADAAARVPSGARIVGDGVAAYAEAFAPRAADLRPDHADAVEVARIALTRDLRGERDALETVVPLYLKSAEPEARTHG